MPRTLRVSWHIDFDPDPDWDDHPPHIQAAVWSLGVMQDPESVATVFTVTDPDSGKYWIIDAENLDKPEILEEGQL